MNCYYFPMGGHGDIIYSIPSTKILGDGIYWFDGEFGPNIIDNIGPLLLEQPHVKGVKHGPVDSTQFDGIFYDMTHFWRQPDLGKVLLPINMARSLHIPNFVLEYPFLTISNTVRRIDNPYVIIGRTPRYRDPHFNWIPIINDIVENTSYEIYFNGYQEEYDDFVNQHGFREHISRLECNNFLDIAEYVCGAEAIYCNQTSLVTVAQGLGKKYFLEKAPGHLNCIWNIPAETVMNPHCR